MNDRARSIIISDFQDEDGNVEFIETIANRPFYVEGRGWTRVDGLDILDRVPSSDGRTLVVRSAVWTDRIEVVYNFGVEGFHTYFVGEGGAWVHNCNETKALEEIKDAACEEGIRNTDKFEVLDIEKGELLRSDGPGGGKAGVGERHYAMVYDGETGEVWTMSINWDPTTKSVTYTKPCSIQNGEQQGGNYWPEGLE